MAISALSNTSHIALHRMYRHRKYRQPTPAKPAITIVMPIYYSRPVDSPPADLYFAPVFLLFLFNESLQKRPKAVWCHIWQDVGPDWEGRVRKFQTNPSRGFSRGSEKLSKKYAFTENFRPKVLYNGEAHEQSALNHHRSPPPRKLYSE